MLGLRSELVFNGGIMELPVREYESLRGISCLDGSGGGIGIVDDSVSDMRFRGYCEDVNLTEACLLTIIVWEIRRREIIRRDYLVVGLFIILREVLTENYYFRSSYCTQVIIVNNNMLILKDLY